MIDTEWLVAYWHHTSFDGAVWNNIAPDTEGSFNSMSVLGATKQSDSVYFDGVDDLVSFPSLFSGTYPISFDMWISADGSGYNSRQYLLSGHSSSYAERLFLDSRYYISIGTGGWIDYSVDPRGAGWVHLAAVFDMSTGITLYRNGVSIGSVSSSGGWTRGIDLGGFVGNTSYFYKGKVALLRFYEKALTLEQIQQNYNTGMEVGLSDTSSPTVPTPTIVSVNAPTTDNTISDEPTMDRATVTFKFDTDVDEWTVRCTGTSPDTGILCDSGGAVTAGTEVAAEIDYTELYSEGQNRINIYGKNAAGWTPYSG